MDQFFAEFQRDGGICQPLASWKNRPDSQQLFGSGSPLKAGMLVYALGWCWNGSGSIPIVNVPAGWQNLGYGPGGSAGVRSNVGIWQKLITSDETPDFFSGDSENQISFYGFPPPGARDPEWVDWNNGSSTGNPPASTILRSGGVNTYRGDPALIAAVFISSSSPVDDTISYNGGTPAAQVRDAMDGVNVKAWARLQYVKRLTTDITVDMGDNGSHNQFVGACVNLFGVY